MLKTIALSELELGMFVEKMQGSWLDHPFWKSRFLLDDEGKLRTLKASRLEGVVIDTAKGKDVAGPSGEQARAATASAPAGARIARIKERTSPQRRPPQPVSTEKEVQAAEAIAHRSKEQIHKVFSLARLGKAINVRAVEPVVSDILDSVRRNPQAFGGLMRCKLKNELAYRHALAVSALMISLARQLKLPEHEVREAGLAGLLLDIGTNYLPAHLKPPNGDYRTIDPKIWQQHVMLGYRVLQDDDTISRAALEACLQHHERIDSTGFPKGLKGDEIGRIGRMAAICDTFDFLMLESGTAGGLDPAEAVRKLSSMEGAFDPDILRAFIESVGLYPVGAFVRLRSDKLAMVVDLDPKQGDKPVVEAFYSYASEERLIQHRIALANPDCDDEIVTIADLAGLGLPPDAQLRELVFLAAYKLAS